MNKKVYQIICDESRQTKDRFMILGGLIIENNSIVKFNKTMEKYRNETKMNAELKWSKVSHQKYEEYKIFVDFFFALINNDIVHFKSLIIDTHRLDHRKYNKGDREIGFYKFYYQLLLHSFASNYYDRSYDTRFIIKLDHRNSSYNLGDLHYILNKGFNKKFKIEKDPFVSVEAVDSKKSELMQINDIVLGSIGYIKNGLPLIQGSKRSKIDLSNYILKKAGIGNYDDSTFRYQKRFSVWNFKLKK